MLHHQLPGMRGRSERVMSQARTLSRARSRLGGTIAAVPRKAQFVRERLWGKITDPGSDRSQAERSRTSGGRREGEALQVIGTA